MTNSPMRRSPRFGGGMVPHRAQSSISPSFALNVDSAPRPPVLVATIPQFNQNITEDTYSRELDVFRIQSDIRYLWTTNPDTKLDQFRPYIFLPQYLAAQGRPSLHDPSCVVMKMVKVHCPKMTFEDARYVLHKISEESLLAEIKWTVDSTSTIRNRTKAKTIYDAYHMFPRQPPPARNPDAPSPPPAPPGHTWESATLKFAENPRKPENGGEWKEHMKMLAKTIVAVEETYAELGTELDLIEIACRAVEIYNHSSPENVKQYINPASEDPVVEGPATVAAAERNVRSRNSYIETFMGVNQNDFVSTMPFAVLTAPPPAIAAPASFFAAPMDVPLIDAVEVRPYYNANGIFHYSYEQRRSQIGSLLVQETFPATSSEQGSLLSGEQQHVSDTTSPDIAGYGFRDVLDADIVFN